MIAILSPAKKLNENSLEDYSLEFSQARFLDDTEELMKYLKKNETESYWKVDGLECEPSRT